MRLTKKLALLSAGICVLQNSTVFFLHSKLPTGLVLPQLMKGHTMILSDVSIL